MKDVFKYARNIQPGDIDSEGRTVRAVYVTLVYDSGPMVTVPADDVQLFMDAPRARLQSLIESAAAS
jgi:hypothetical protein